jgi:hypothetical protein
MVWAPEGFKKVRHIINIDSNRQKKTTLNIRPISYIIVFMN